MGAVIATGNLLEEIGASLAASSTAGALGVNNLLTPRVVEVYRSASQGEVVIRGVLAGVREAGLLLLAAPTDGPLCEAHARIRLTCSAVAVDGTDILDTGDVCGAMPQGRWAWPIGGGVDPQRIWNPSCVDGADGWTPGGAKVPTIAPATGRWRLDGDGSGVLALAGSLVSGGGAMEAAFGVTALLPLERAPLLSFDTTPAGFAWPSALAITRPHTPDTAVTTRTNALGVVEEIAQNLPRLQFDQAGVCLGWMLEPGTTNLITAPRDLDNAAWAKDRATVTANALAAPNGKAEADKVAAGGTTSGAYVRTMTAAIGATIAGQAYTVSAWFAPSGTAFPWALLTFDAAAFGAGVAATVNTITRAIVSAASVTARIIEIRADGWFRVAFSAKATTATSATNVNLAVNATNSLSAVASRGGTDGFHAWGVQYEARSFPTALVMLPSGSIGTAARGEENGTWSLGGSVSRLALFAHRRVDFSDSTDETSSLVLSRGASTADKMRLATTGAAGTFRSYTRCRMDAVYQQQATSGLIPLGTFTRHAMSAGQDYVRVYRDGVLEASDDAINFNPLNTLYVTGGEAVVYLREFRVYDAALSEAHTASLSGTGLIRGGELWEMQAALLPRRCQGLPVLRWLDAQGATLAETTGEVVAPSVSTDGRKLSRYRVSRVAGLPPPGARSVVPVLRGQGDAVPGLDPSLVFTRTALSRGINQAWSRSFIRTGSPPAGGEAFQFFTLRINSALPFIQAGRLFVAPALFTERNPEYGMQDGDGDGGTSTRAEGSGLRFFSRGRWYRTRSMRVSAMFPDEVTVAKRLRRTSGKTDQFFVAPMIERMNDEGILGAVQNMSFTETSFDRLAMDAAMEEDC